MTTTTRVLPSHIKEVKETARCLFDKSDVEHALDCMAESITDAVGDANPLFLCVVVGGIIPLGHLLIRLHFPLAVNYIHATRYLGDVKGGEELHFRSEPTCSLQGRTVIIVDDILDGGVTITGILDYCRKAGAKRTYSTVLVNKQREREANSLKQADFVGLQVQGTPYLFGYGMDYKEYLRNAPGIYAVDDRFLSS